MNKIRKEPRERVAIVAEKKAPEDHLRASRAVGHRDVGREPGRMAKPQRQHRIARILEQHAVGNQLQLVELLAEDNVIATQATVSRDLEDMGAVKVRVPGGELVYAIPELPISKHTPEDNLRRVFGDWVVDVAHSGHLVVLRTPPGSAHVVASALDRAGLEEIIGTVAGDDTILIVCAERTPGRTFAERMRVLAGL